MYFTLMKKKVSQLYAGRREASSFVWADEKKKRIVGIFISENYYYYYYY